MRSLPRLPLLLATVVETAPAHRFVAERAALADAAVELSTEAVMLAAASSSAESSAVGSCSQSAAGSDADHCATVFHSYIRDRAPYAGATAGGGTAPAAPRAPSARAAAAPSRCATVFCLKNRLKLPLTRAVRT
jgi:hypothetical protein